MSSHWMIFQQETGRWAWALQTPPKPVARFPLAFPPLEEIAPRPSLSRGLESRFQIADLHPHFFRGPNEMQPASVAARLPAWARVHLKAAVPAFYPGFFQVAVPESLLEKLFHSVYHSHQWIRGLPQPLHLHLRVLRSLQAPRSFLHLLRD